MIYIREAHALDGRSPLRGGAYPLVEEPATLGERGDVARFCMARTALEPMRALVDGMDNAVDKAYAAAPDRLYLVGRDGNVAYRGGRGPFGFKPDELEAAIVKELTKDGLLASRTKHVRRGFSSTLVAGRQNGTTEITEP